MHSVPKDHGFAERQPGVGTIPIPEFVDRVPVGALSIGAGKAVEDSGFRDFEVWQPQHRFSRPGLLHCTYDFASSPVAPSATD
jgi:hypothetical protein